MSVGKRYLVWSAVYLVAWVWLWFFTDIRITFLQGALVLVAMYSYGASRHLRGVMEERKTCP